MTAIGPFVRRKHRAFANAAQFLEPGEAGRHLVTVQAAGSLGSGGDTVTDYVSGVDTGTYATGGQPMLLALTDRYVRIFTMGAWTAVNGAPVRIPLTEAQVEIRKVAGGLVRPDLVVNGRKFSLMPFHKNRRDAKRLVGTLGGLPPSR